MWSRASLHMKLVLFSICMINTTFGPKRFAAVLDCIGNHDPTMGCGAIDTVTHNSMHCVALSGHDRWVHFVLGQVARAIPKRKTSGATQEQLLRPNPLRPWWVFCRPSHCLGRQSSGQCSLAKVTTRTIAPPGHPRVLVETSQEDRHKYHGPHGRVRCSEQEVEGCQSQGNMSADQCRKEVDLPVPSVHLDTLSIQYL